MIDDWMWKWATSVGMVILLAGGAGCGSEQVDEETSLTDTGPSGDVETDADQPDTDVGPREWAKLEGFYGGHVAFKLDGKVFARAAGRPGEPVEKPPPLAAFSANGESWQRISTSDLSSVLSGARQPSYIETDDYRYIVAAFGEDAQTGRLFRAPSDSSNFSERTWPDELAGDPVVAAGGKLIARYTDGDVSRRDDAGNWTNIEPESAVRVDGFTVWNDRLYLRADDPSGNRGDNKLWVSTDAGDTWQEVGGRFDSSTPPENWVAMNGRLYAFGDLSPQDGEFPYRTIGFLDGSGQWKMLGQSTEFKFDETNPVGLEGKLYSINRRGQLVRIEIETAETNPVTVEEVTRKRAFELEDLVRLEDRLLATRALNNGGSVVLQWQPGESSWSIAPVADGRAENLWAASNTVWASSGLVQTYRADMETWRLQSNVTGFPNNRNLFDGDTTVFGVFADGCLYRSSTQGWRQSMDAPSFGDPAEPCTDDAYRGRLASVAETDGDILFGLDRVTIPAENGGPGQTTQAGGGIIRWDTEPGETNRLQHPSLRGDEFVGVQDITVRDGTTWAILTEETNPMGEDASDLYRLENGSWEHVPIQLRNAPELTNPNPLGIEGDRRILYARFALDASNTDAPVERIFRWSNDANAFEPLPTLNDPEPPRRLLTQAGPVATTETRIARYDPKADEWRDVHTERPGSGGAVSAVATGNGRMYVGLETGGIWGIQLRQLDR